MLLAVDFQASHDVLDVHHRVIDQAPNGNRQPPQRHGVDGQAKVFKNQTGDEDRHRNGGQRNERGPQGAQKHKQNDRHKHRRPNQLALERGDRRFNEAGLAERDARRLHACGQRLRQVAQRRLNGASQGDGVRRGLLLNAQNDGWLAFKSGIATLDGGCKRHVCYLPEQHGLVVSGSQRQIFKVVEPGGSPQVADQVLPTVELQKAARRIRRKAFERPGQLVMGNAQFCHAHRVGLHLELAHLTTNGDDLRHTRNGHQTRPQHPVRVLPHGHRRQLLHINRNSHLHDFTHDGADRPHAGDHAGRHAFFHG